MSQYVKESTALPVNELGEVVFTQSGVGSTNIAGFLPPDFVPTDTRTGAFRAVFAKPSAETATVDNPLTYYVKEGTVLKVTSNNATGTITKYKSDGSVDFTQTMSVAGAYIYGPYDGTQKFVIAPATNTATVQSSSTVPTPSTTISSACKFYYPWVRDGSNNVINKGPNSGDAVKTATSAATQTGGYFTSVAGTYGSSGTGRYYVAPATSSNFDPNSETVILNIGFNKATPSGNENFAGTQTNSSTSGFQFQAQSAGNLLVNYKPGTTQNAFTAVSGLLDSTDRQITIVIDRATKNGYVFVDSVLRETKTNINYTGTASALQTFVFGGYSAGAAYDAKFFNCQMYAIPRDAADINIQACIDKITLQKAPLTIADLGV